MVKLSLPLLLAALLLSAQRPWRRRPVKKREGMFKNTVLFCLFALIVNPVCSLTLTGLAATSDNKVNCPKVVIAHWMPQLELDWFNHHLLYRDLPLIGPMQFRGDPVQQMKEAKAYGIDAFAICSSNHVGWNQMMWGRSIKSADLIPGFFVCPAICNGPGASNPNRGIMLQAAIDWLKDARGHRSPLRVGGKVVLSSYHWGETTKQEVETFRKTIKDATGEDVFLMTDVDGSHGSVSMNNADITDDLSLYPVDGVKGLAEGSDMIFLFWPRRLPVVDKTAAISRECGILFGGDDVPGYWRPEYGIWVPFDHTARLRAMLSANIKFGARWLNITTWNDYSENTLVQPSANWGDTRASIVKFYGDVLKQRPIEGSRFFVTSPGEARLGIPFSIEALVLQPDNTSRHVTVWLADGRGNEIARWTGDTPPDIDSVGYAKFTLNSYPEGRFVRAHVEFQRKGDKPLSLIGSPINVWPDVDRGLINRSMFSLSDKSSGTFGQVSLSFVQDKPGEGLIRVNLVPRTSGYGEFEPWAEVQLLYGDIVLKRILRNEGPLELKWPVENFPVDYRFYKFPRSFRCGFVAPRLITMDGTIVYGDPLWIGPPPRANLCQAADIPMTDICGNAILDKSLYANHLRISGDVKAVHPTVGPDGKHGLWVSPKAGIQMHPSMLPTGIFTMNLRLMPDSIDTLQKVIDNSEGNNTGGIKFRLSILPGGKLQFIRDNCESTSSEGLVSGRWNNVYIQFDGTTIFFQIEGKAAGAKSFAPSKTYLTPFGREVEQLPGRIDPRFITSIAKSYHGGIADLSISSVISNVNRNDHKP